ncbi:TetR/AcrR family transcriptional regulator [Nonomuraea sediminis]|uniref:TetR/AcrR family transcriptional regulator n=1 Tax=Nonomuraea sediminis TaxID=2835864 RepID=UPI001BDD9847|nr:TetR/AcrR family transcriptional regulator C-terminal domain-containing protein [Nonomuraea sediminis]
MKQRGGRPAVLSLDRILAAAVEVVDAEGTEALTMRRLGAQLGVAPMSLYRHVPNHDALLAAVVNRLFSEVELTLGQSWPETLYGFAAAYRRMLLAHPGAVPLLATHPVDLEIGLQLVSGLLDQFAATGVAQEEAITVVQSVGVYVLGHALAQVGPHEPTPPAEFYDTWFDAGLRAMITGFSAVHR